MKCYKCGHAAPENARFCAKCGAPLIVTENLLQRAAANDQNAIAQLYEMTYNNVYLTIRMLIRDEDRIQDLLQDTYIKAFANLAQLKAPEAFRGWVKRIAHNLAIDDLRKKQPTVFSATVSADSDEFADFKDERPESMPEEVVDYGETKRLLDAIMNALPEEQRAVISLHYYEGYAVKDIAAMLGVSENTVKSRLLYGRRKIELEVRALEKEGTKLYGLAPMPFLLFLFRNLDAQAAELPDPRVLQALRKISAPAAQSPAQPAQRYQPQRASGAHSAQGAHGAHGAASHAVKAGVKAAKAGAGIAGKSLAIKVAAGIAAAAVLGGGIGVAVATHFHNRPAVEAVVEPVPSVLPVEEEPVPLETPQVLPVETAEPTPVPTPEPTAEPTPIPIPEPTPEATEAPAGVPEQPEEEDRWPGFYAQMMDAGHSMEITSDGGAYRVTFRDSFGNTVLEMAASIGDNGFVTEDGSVRIVMTGRDQRLVECDSDLQGSYLLMDPIEPVEPVETVETPEPQGLSLEDFMGDYTDGENHLSLFMNSETEFCCAYGQLLYEFEVYSVVGNPLLVINKSGVGNGADLFTLNEDGTLTVQTTSCPFNGTYWRE